MVMIKVDTRYHIPWMAGYNVDGDILYIDSRIPRVLRARDGQVIRLHEFLQLHELVEAQLEHHLGYTYQKAHRIATNAEREAVEQAGIDWGEYSNLLKPYAELCRTTFTQVPRELDLQPYRDSGETKLIAKIKEAMVDGIDEEE